MLLICESCNLTNDLAVHQCMTTTALQVSAQMLQLVANEQTKPDQPMIKLIKDGYGKAGA